MIKIDGKEVVFETFPNGESRLLTDAFPKSTPNQIYNVIHDIHFKYETDADLIKLMMVKDYMVQSNIAMFGHLVIYYMPYSRMDRSESNSPFTLKYVANFINDLAFSNVKIIEPHSDVTPALVDNSESVYINFDLIEKVKEEVGFDEENDFLMFPDAGAQKRYSKMKAKNVVVGNKVRDFETGEIKGLDLIGNTIRDYGKKVIIVDDLSSYGGTFVHSADLLRKHLFEEVHLLVAHAENSIFKGKLFDNVDKVFTTDSILTEQDNPENKKFENQLTIYPIDTLKI